MTVPDGSTESFARNGISLDGTQIVEQSAYEVAAGRVAELRQRAVLNDRSTLEDDDAIRHTDGLA
jgi:hypothetical protein